MDDRANGVNRADSESGDSGVMNAAEALEEAMEPREAAAPRGAAVPRGAAAPKEATALKETTAPREATASAARSMPPPTFGCAHCRLTTGFVTCMSVTSGSKTPGWPGVRRPSRLAVRRTTCASRKTARARPPTEACPPTCAPQLPTIAPPPRSKNSRPPASVEAPHTPRGPACTVNGPWRSARPPACRVSRAPRHAVRRSEMIEMHARQRCRACMAPVGGWPRRA